MHLPVMLIPLVCLSTIIPDPLALDSKPATSKDTAATILALERAALDRWGKGDPDGFLEITGPDVVYFDPFQPRRVNGIEQLRKLYDEARGKIRIEHYEIIDPKVQVTDELAVLTYNFASRGSEGEMRWNTTEVYQLRSGQWRIIHTHWSLTQPKLAAPSE
jgi:ketosteroid isomerase-like protein